MFYLSKKRINEIFSNRKENIINFSVKDSMNESLTITQFDVFLSYSYLDKEYAIKIYYLLKDCGYSVYIDLKDSKLDRDDVDEDTAKRIAKIMNRCKSLIYVHTPSAKVSKWCPWELGYMSGRTNFRCGIIPLIEDKEEFPHQEYLGIYPIIDYAPCKNTSNNEFWVNNSKTGSYVKLKLFINGADPK